MQIGEGSLAPSRSAPAPSNRTQTETGTVEITVELAALCWDTFADDGSEGNRALAGASVTLGGHGPAVVTGDDGVARFERVRVGTADVAASKLDYVGARDSLSVQANATTSRTLTLQSSRLECSRRHTRLPSGTPGANVLAPIFWVDEPALLLVRDVLWIALGTMTIVFFVVGLFGPNQGLLAMAAAFFAVFSWHTHIIFGMVAGIVTMLLAFGAFVAVAAMTLVGLTSSVLPPPDAGVFAVVCALWAGFIAMLVAGRQRYATIYLWVPLPAALVGLVIALVVYLLVVWAASPTAFAPDIGWAIGVPLFGAVLGFVGGAFSWVFVNDGNLESPQFGLTDAKLPYIGERYCLQGHRGLFSHYDDGEEAYDFIAPVGTPVLAIKEGHIIKFREDSNEGREANAIYVRHRDGSIAEYLHLKDGGVSDFNPDVTSPATAGELPRNPVHCHQGQRLAASGETGDAFTPHIHVAVHHPGPVARNFMAFLFEDADVARHEGRAFTMRKYRSDNLDRGRVTVPR